MSPSITLADGRILEVECLSCALVSGVVPPVGGVIFESAHFHVHQDVAYPIRGLVIIAAKRHLYCLDNLPKWNKMNLSHWSISSDTSKE